MFDNRTSRLAQVVFSLVVACGVSVSAQQTDPYGSNYSPPYDTGPAPQRDRRLRVPLDDQDSYERSPDRAGFDDPDAPRTNSRARLEEELRRIRRPGSEQAQTAFNPPLPVRRKPGAPEAVAVENKPAPLPQNPIPAAPPIPRELEQLLSQRFIIQFAGTQPGDAGVKAARSLIQSGSIAGVVLDKNNVVSKAQLRELLRFFAQAGGRQKPFLAAREIGGSSTSFTFEKGFEPWPSQQAVAAKRDPQYSYSTYQTLSANLEYLGFNMNFGPRIALPDGPSGPADSFANDPLQIAVYAKTFILGHVEAGVIPVPILDAGDKPIQSLKALLVSYPDTPVAAGQSPESTTFHNYGSLIRGARFCFVSGKPEAVAAEVPESFRRGCDILVLTTVSEPPPVVLQRAMQTVAAAVRKGELTLALLSASSPRIDALRGTLATH